MSYEHLFLPWWWDPSVFAADMHMHAVKPQPWCHYGVLGPDGLFRFCARPAPDCSRCELHA